MYRGLIILWLVALTAQSSAQDMDVRGYFLEDTIRIGLGTPYILTAKYPADADILFPDSLYDYSPYELGEKKFYPTVTKNGISYDSAIYYLLSFEVDSIQYAGLPVFRVIGNDSIELKAERDAIILKHMVAEIPDSVAVEAMPLIENTTYKYVKQALNYPYLIIGVTVFVLTIVILWIIFGKHINRWFKIRRLNKNHNLYLTSFDSLSSRSADTEKLIVLWKTYHEELEKVPYTKLTTKELMRLENTKSVEEALRNVDRAIYGKKTKPDPKTLEQLRAYSVSQYQNKVTELSND